MKDVPSKQSLCCISFVGVVVSSQHAGQWSGGKEASACSVFTKRPPVQIPVQQNFASELCFVRLVSGRRVFHSTN